MEFSYSHAVRECGMWFFVKYYDLLKLYANGGNKDQIRSTILRDMGTLHTEKGERYSIRGTDIRIANSLLIFETRTEMKALELIKNTSYQPVIPDTAQHAAELLKRELIAQ